MDKKRILEQVSEEMRVCEQSYYELVNSINEGFVVMEVIFDAAGKPLDCYHLEINSAFEIISGFNRKELLGKSLLELLKDSYSHEELENRINIYANVVFTGNSARLQRTGRKGGQYYDEYIFRFGSKQCAVLLIDVTEEKKREEDLRKTHEELEGHVEERTKQLERANEELQCRIIEQLRLTDALQESEEKFRKLGETAPALIYIFQGNSMQFVNSEFISLTGYSREECLEMNIWDFVHPDYRDLVKVRALARQRGEDIINRYNLKMLRKNGQVFWINLSSTLIELGGERAVIGLGVDISKQIKDEEILRQSEIMYRTIFETTGAAMMFFEEDMLISLVNQEFEKLSGYSRQEIENKMSWTEFVAEDDLEKMKEYHRLRRRVKGKAPTSYEFKLINKQGEIKDVFISVDIIPGSSKSVASFMDISERKQTQGQLEYRLSVEEAVAKVSYLFVAPGQPDIHKALSILGEIVCANRAYIFQIRENGRKMDNTFEWCSPGTEPEIDLLQDLDTGIFPWWMKRLNNNETIAINDVNDLAVEAIAEKEILQAQGIKSLLVVPIFSVHDKLMGYMGFDDTEKYRLWNIQDIQALKIVSEILGVYWERKRTENELQLSESRYRAVVEDQTELISRFLPCGTLTFVNDAYCRYFEQKREKLLGKNVRSLLSEDGQDYFNKDLDSLNSGKTVVLKTVEVKRDNGETGWQEWTIRMIRGEDGDIAEFQAVGHDITERRQMEDKMAQINKMEAIGQLAAGIAHEINTPLQYVGDNTRFLQESFDNLERLIKLICRELANEKLKQHFPDLFHNFEELQEEIELDYLLGEVPQAIGQSLEGLERVSKLVRTMKEYAHPSSKHKLPANLNREIESAIALSRNEWKYFAEMETDLQTDSPGVPCVVDEINQVILNIIINAADAIKEAVNEGKYDKGIIRIETRVKEGLFIMIISDNGAGIPESIRHRIFEPFFTTKEVGKGTGQGLAIAHNIIVNKHGGSLDFSSESGKGTIFSISLPINIES